MTLTKYREKYGLTLAVLASDIGCSIAMLNFVERGLRAPSMDMAYRIERATKGRVSIRDLPRRAA